jgi:ABC-type dipeptide/oligopeptide/nickel transport system permease subunit
MAKISKEDKEREMKQANTAFIMTIPTLIIAIFAVATLGFSIASLIVLICLVYQYNLINNFIKDYWKARGQ